MSGDKTKNTNPKDALGTAKVPMHCVSARVLMEMGLGMMEGGRKYGTHNYRKMGVLASVYYDAVMRHLMAWWEGEDIDADSGLSHITKAMATLSVLLDSILMKNWKDDRPIQLPDGLNLAELNEKAKKIIEKYPESKKPYTQVGKYVGVNPVLVKPAEAYSSGAHVQCECILCRLGRAKDGETVEVSDVAHRPDKLGCNCSGCRGGKQ